MELQLTTTMQTTAAASACAKCNFLISRSGCNNIASLQAPHLPASIYRLLIATRCYRAAAKALDHRQLEAALLCGRECCNLPHCRIAVWRLRVHTLTPRKHVAIKKMASKLTKNHCQQRVVCLCAPNSQPLATLALQLIAQTICNNTCNTNDRHCNKMCRN